MHVMSESRTQLQSVNIFLFFYHIDFHFIGFLEKTETNITQWKKTILYFGEMRVFVYSF